MFNMMLFPVANESIHQSCYFCYDSDLMAQTPHDNMNSKS